MSHYTMPIFLGVAGASFIAFGLLVALWRLMLSRHEARAEGTVTEMKSRGSGEFPVVTFTPEGSIAPQPVTFWSNYSSSEYQVGQKVSVFYDRRNPDHATLMTARASWAIALVLVVAGLMFMPFAAWLGLWVAPDEAARERAIMGFLAAVRSGNAAAKRAHTTDAARFDDAFLQSVVRPSTSFVPGNSATEFDGTSCVGGSLEPGGSGITLSLIKVNGAWKVRAAGFSVPECAGRLD